LPPYSSDEGFGHFQGQIVVDGPHFTRAHRHIVIGDTRAVRHIARADIKPLRRPEGRMQADTDRDVGFARRARNLFAIGNQPRADTALAVIGQDVEVLNFRHPEAAERRIKRVIIELDIAGRRPRCALERQKNLPASLRLFLQAAGEISRLMHLPHPARDAFKRRQIIDSRFADHNPAIACCHIGRPFVKKHAASVPLPRGVFKPREKSHTWGIKQPAGFSRMDDTRTNPAPSHFLLHCYRLDGKGGAVACDLQSALGETETPVWIHLNGRHGDAKKFLRDDIGLEPLLVKSMLAEETRPRLEEAEQGTLLILRGINHNPGPEPEDLVSIRLWMSGHRIITISRRKARAISDLDERMKQHRGPRKIGEFISMLCMCIDDGIEPTINSLEDTIDALEDISADQPTPTLRGDLASVRKQATLFRRHLSPLRDVVSRLQKTDQLWLSPSDKWSLHDSLDRLTRFLEELDALRERSQILQDEIYSAMSARLNRNIYLLSMITVIFMPLTYITGLLGMNVEGIPAATKPYAFQAVCGISLCVAFVQLYIFRKLKWF